MRNAIRYFLCLSSTILLVWSSSTQAQEVNPSEAAVNSAESISTTRTGLPAAIENEAAWKLLPESQSSRTAELPRWARTLVAHMPNTTAALLQLDYAHRRSGPVDHRLRSAMRWVAAKANGCSIMMKMAFEDGLRFGEKESRLVGLQQDDYRLWNESEKAALEFALAMTVDSDGYSDEQFQKLVDMYSPEVVGSMVLHLAFANFQDRLCNCLGIDQEQDDPLPPVDYGFDMGILAAAAKATAPPPPAPATEEPKSNDTIRINAQQSQEYTWLDYSGLQEQLVKQRARSSRLPSPDWSKTAALLPPGLMDGPTEIVWYQLAFGYAHELAVPFEYYLQIAGQDVRRSWDRTFGGCLFWMVTDSIHCPYCMGHCEMNWEVAGLDANKIESLSRSLAGNDWSDFSKPQQSALAFARKLTKTPFAISRSDVQSLRDGFGDQQAVHILLQCSRYNYMVRISNGFQLTLESDNVFWDYYKMPRPKR